MIQTHHADKTTKHRMILPSFQSFILTWRATLALNSTEHPKHMRRRHIKSTAYFAYLYFMHAYVKLKE